MSDEADVWSRRRLLVVLGLAVSVAAVLVISAGYAVWVGATSEPDLSVGPSGFPVGTDGVRGAAYRDAVAAEPMLASTADDLQPAAPARWGLPDLRVPAGRSTGPAGVAAGYGHTSAGAVGQLAAITTAALDGLSTDHARDVYTAWAADGGRFHSWEIARAIDDFHAAAGSTDGDASAVLTARPVGAQVKARDGDNWVIVCVQLDVVVVTAEETRFGYGHCDRMQWTGSRWEIAAGSRPAPAPSTWPRSDRSVEAGWRGYVEVEDEVR